MKERPSDRRHAGAGLLVRFRPGGPDRPVAPGQRQQRAARDDGEQVAPLPIAAEGERPGWGLKRTGRKRSGVLRIDDMAADHGHLTKADQHQLNREANRQSARIYHDKHETK